MARMIIVGSLGEYRSPTMRLLRRRLGDQYQLFSGTLPAERSIRTLTSRDLEMNELHNFYIPGGILVQNAPVVCAVKARILVMDLNPRVPHVWLLLLIRKMLRRRTLLWGHAWPRAGRGSKSERIRHLLRALSSGLICYTQTQAVELSSRHPKLDIYTAPNAVIHRDQMVFGGGENRFRFLYSGRLVAEKRVDILVPAFDIAAAIDPDLRLTILGSGPMSGHVESQAARSPFKDRIDILGHVSSYDDLRRLYDESLASLSPGYVGLSITQSLGFGVPMIISRAEPHSPEIEAAVENFNAVFFSPSTPSALACKMMEVCASRGEWFRRGQQIVDDARAKYSVEAMVDGLEAALLSG